MHTVTVTVSNANVSASFDVSFTANGGTTLRPVIGEFANHKGNTPIDQYTIVKNALGQTVISYSTKTNWTIAQAKVTGYTSEYTRLCITAMFTGTQQFAVEAEIIGKSGQVLRNPDAPSKSAVLNPDGSYTYDILIPESMRTSGISDIYFYLDPTVNVSGTPLYDNC